MGDTRTNSASMCNGPLKSPRENKENVTTPVSGRVARSAFSDPFSSLDMKSFDQEEVLMEGEKEKEKEKEKEEDKEKGEEACQEWSKKDEIEVSSRKGGVEGDSVSLESERLSKESTLHMLESETASSRASNSDSDGQSQSTSPLFLRDFFGLFKKPSARFQKFPLTRGFPKLTRRKSKRIRDAMLPTLKSPLDGELCYLKPSWKNFALADIQVATNNFSPENLIGQGGYAEVYKGQLENGQFVAIKRLTRGSPEEMTVDFLSELGIIVHVDHPNVAKLIGYGVEGGMHLVLELSVNGSLSSLLYGPKEKLDWGIRYKIALGTAEGLWYLHEGCQRRIIHKDIKASNILLTENFEAQISDFGLAKWLPEQWTHHTVSQFEGTFGYLPPEFFMHGIVDEKTDVYAYGVLLLELITGRQALDSSQQSLVMWAKPLLMKSSSIKELVDPTLADAYDLEQMDRLVCTASICIDPSSAQRPQMSQVVYILKGDESSLEEVRQRRKSKLQRTYSEELLDAEEYNSTKYLNDLNKHMEVVLGKCNDSTTTIEESSLIKDTNNMDQQEEVIFGYDT